MKIYVLLLCLVLVFPAYGGISISTDGGNRTVTLEYTSTIDRVSTTLEEAAETFYVHEGIGHVFNAGVLVPFADLTNQQKLHIIDVAVKQYLIQKARDNHVETALQDVRETAENEDILIEE